jgi:NitT/TauT family transport system ATP-binding protein
VHAQVAGQQDQLRRAHDLTVLKLEHITHAFGPLAVIEDVSLTVAEGEFVALLGPSGAGKSTLLRMMAGLIRPERGRVTWRGQPVVAQPPRVGMVFQSSSLLPWRTALANVGLPLELDGRPRVEVQAAAKAWLARVGLHGFEQALPSTLSGGMRQRVALARALVAQPDLVLLDEPFGALDALTREQLGVELLRMWEAERTTLAMVTHSLSEALLLADRVAVLSARPGRLLTMIDVPFSRPRTLDLTAQPAFQALVRDVRSVMLARTP